MVGTSWETKQNIFRHNAGNHGPRGKSLHANKPFTRLRWIIIVLLNDETLNRNETVEPLSTTGRKWKIGGVDVSVMTRDDAGVDADEPWIASCDTHGEMLACPTKRSAESAARNRD